LKRFSIILLILIFSGSLFAQDENPLEQEQWEAIRDKFAVDAIKLLAKLDTLNGKIDSLKTVLDYANNFNCEEELYKAVGTTKDEVSRFRSKFEYTESRIYKKEGTPQDARNMYFDEITASKLRCLPEFRDRYKAMNIALTDMGGNEKVITETQTDSLTYLVTEGDNLGMIAEKIYGSADQWRKIWKANKDGVANSDELTDLYMSKIINPDKIYPGQILHIPSK